MVSGYIIIPTRTIVGDLYRDLIHHLAVYSHHLPRDQVRPDMTLAQKEIKQFVRDYMAHFIWHWGNQHYLVRADRRSSFVQGIQAGVAPPITPSGLSLFSIPHPKTVQLLFEVAQSQNYPLAQVFHRATLSMATHLDEILGVEMYDGLVGNKIEFIRWDGDDMVMRIYSDEDRLGPL